MKKSYITSQNALEEVRVLHDVLAVLCHNPAAQATPQGAIGIPGFPPTAQVGPLPPAPPPTQNQGASTQKYLTLAGISTLPQDRNKGVNQSMAVTVYAKKKALTEAGALIARGAEALNKNPNDKSNDFHRELLLLRQHYRLRRAGDKILGDVSFRTCGSRNVLQL